MSLNGEMSDEAERFDKTINDELTIIDQFVNIFDGVVLSKESTESSSFRLRFRTKY